MQDIAWVISLIERELAEYAAAEHQALYAMSGCVAEASMIDELGSGRIDLRPD